MDFTEKILTEKGTNLETQETYKNEEGVNDTRTIQLDYLRMVQASLLKCLPAIEDNSEMNMPEMLEARFDLHQRITEAPKAIKFNKVEKELVISLVALRFPGDVVLMARLLKKLNEI